MRRVCYSQGPNKPGWEEMLTGDSRNGHYANCGTDTIVKDEIVIHDIWKTKTINEGLIFKAEQEKVDAVV